MSETNQAGALGQSYSSADRMIHKIATGQLDMQRMLAGLEDKMFASRIEGVAPGAPVFVTSLPRAGTTLLLEVLAEEPGLISHTYRQMPFLLCPLIWDRLTRRSQKKAEARERAHGDGMQVSFDSVEAFEEMIWRAFWPERFETARIRPWTPKTKDLGFTPFMQRHFTKLIALNGRREGRYLSKNNANIARLAWLRRAFPDATILIPYRDPVAHIRSMLRQHRQFLQAHGEDKFILAYMESIGHLEFGLAHRPIDFGGWLREVQGLDPTSEAYWATYWCAAMESVLDAAAEDPGTHILSYDTLCSTPEPGLAKLSDLLGIEGAALKASAGRFRAPTRHGAEGLAIDPALSTRVAEAADRLAEASMI
ncbi:MAG: sulfotransferase [Pseudomonadota bacterium]